MLVLALTRCASVQEVELGVPAPGVSFEVFADPVDTRTVNDGLSTLWVAGDQFSLFHAKAGSTAYVADGAFAVDDVETGHATGSLASAVTAASDWFMVYPHASSATSPKTVPVTVGAPNGTAQKQAGADDMSHLAGVNFPLAGKVASVAAEATPNLPVAPILSVIAVNVTNPGEGTVTVNSVRFKAPEPIVGSFRVDVTGQSPVFTAVSASDEASLEVVDGAVVKKDENAVFFLGVKPFVAAAGATLTLTVNDEVHTLVLTRSVTFVPGKIKTLNVTLEPSDPDPTGTYYFKRVSAFSAGKQYIFVVEEQTEDGETVLHMANALPEGTKSGRLAAEDVEDANGVITLPGLENAFTFYESENGTLIRQADGRYLYNNNTNDNFYAAETLSAGSYWTVSFDASGLASIVNRQRQAKYNPEVEAFQTRLTNNSGLLPRLYELQNSDDAVQEFIKNTTPGVYAYEGTDWLYEDGSMQLSVRTGGGQTAFRIYEPSTYTVVQITGLPETVSENDVFDVRLARYVKQAVTHISTLSAKVVHLEGGKAWLLAGNGTGFIVCLQ